MYIVVVGGGKVGASICHDLVIDGHDIVLVEKDPEVLDGLLDSMDITGVVGNGATFEVLDEAEVQDCDIFIAVTNSDELNIIASIMANKIGAKKTIARVVDPDYFQNMEFVRKDLRIDLMINPEREAATKISQVLKFPSSYNVESFLDGDVNIVEYILEEDNPLIGKAIKDVKLDNVLICMVERSDEVFVPNGDFILEEEDQIHVTGDIDGIRSFTDYCKVDQTPISSTLIIGASQLTYYLVDTLKSKGFTIKVIENDYDKALKIADAFPEVQVIHGDGTDHDFLKVEGIKYYDSLVSATPIDEENIILSLFGISIEVRKIIAKIDQDNLELIANNLDIETVINPKNIIADTILRFIRASTIRESSIIENLHRMSRGRVYAIQFYVKAGYDHIGKPLREIRFNESTLIACIKRGKQIIYPKGDDYILEEDEVLVITKNPKIEEMDQILGEVVE